MRFVFGLINFGNGVEGPFWGDIMAFATVFFLLYEIINTDGRGTISRYLTEVSKLLSAKLFPFRYIQEL